MIYLYVYSGNEGIGFTIIYNAFLIVCKNTFLIVFVVPLLLDVNVLPSLWFQNNSISIIS